MSRMLARSDRESSHVTGPRFMTPAQEAEIVNLFHLARTGLAGSHPVTRHARMLWAVKEFCRLYPEVGETAAYKDLSAALE
jgi:hypothetical protein